MDVVASMPPRNDGTSGGIILGDLDPISLASHSATTLWGFFRETACRLFVAQSRKPWRPRPAMPVMSHFPAAEIRHDGGGLARLQLDDVARNRGVWDGECIAHAARE